MMEMRVGCIFDFRSRLCHEVFAELQSLYCNISKIEHENLSPSHYVDSQVRVLNNSYDYIITLGGDGMMLKALHMFMHANIPIYGINLGSIGFLLNKYEPQNLMQSLQEAELTILHPLQMKAVDKLGKQHELLAVNEVSLLRETCQSAEIQIVVNDDVMIDKLVGDGILLSTSAGSTAYNFAANGPIVPLTVQVLLMTPISPFRPRRWRGAVLPQRSNVKFVNLNPEKRPLSAVADSEEIRDVVKVEIIEKQDVSLKLLFDKEHSLENRVLKEQFMH